VRTSKNVKHSLRAHAACALILCATLVPSCRRSERKIIGVVPKATSHLFWQSVQAGAMKAGRDLNVDIEWNGPAVETDFSRQIQIVDSLIARHVDGIAIAAGDRTALNATLDRAAEAQIPVAVFDSGVDSERYLTFLATNNYAAGQTAARAMARLVGQQGKVIMIMNMPGSRSTMEREQGFEDTLAKEFPRVSIVARQYGLADRFKALSATENLLTANPGIDGLFASSEQSAVGAALAVKERGLSGSLKIVAFDASENMVEDLKAGTLSALVAQDPFGMGYQAVAILVNRIHGITPAHHIDMPVALVEKNDLARPEIQRLLFPDVKAYLK
jgi:ribose transport system substrate-binding protein